MYPCLTPERCYLLTVQDAAPAEPALATPDNLNDVINYLRQALSSHGLPYWDINPQSGRPEDAAFVCNCLFSLIQEHQRGTEHRQRMEDQLQRLRSDARLAEQQAKRAKDLADSKEKEIAALLARVR